jgi:hypothetical protein
MGEGHKKTIAAKAAPKAAPTQPSAGQQGVDAPHEGGRILQ